MMKISILTAYTLLLASTSTARSTAQLNDLAVDRHLPRRPNSPVPGSGPLNLRAELPSGPTNDGVNNGTYRSGNWAGAVHVGTHITQVSATVNFPNVSLPPNPNTTLGYLGSAWVGIDGRSCGSAILQAGIYWTLYGDGSEPEYFAWYEWFPGPVVKAGISAKPGDIFNVEVIASNTTSGAAYIINESTGEAFSKFLTDQPALCMQDVEWILEDNGEAPFAVFDRLTFNNTSYTINGERQDATDAVLTNIYTSEEESVTDCSVPDGSSVQCTYDM